MGPPEGSSMAPGEEIAPGVKRELSVEDLFAPLNRLDVRHPSSITDARSRASVFNAVRPSADASLSSSRRVSVFDTHLTTQQLSFTQSDASLVSIVDRECIRDPVSPTAQSNTSFTRDMAPIPEETGLGFTEKLGTQTHGIMDCNTDEGGSGSGIVFAREQTRTKGCSSASVIDTYLQMQGNSSSDEDQLVVDDRKQRRMLSNRESARRSRLRKQQHLDELRGHVAHLRSQNSQMRSSFNLASQQFTQITEENRQLRSEAMDLSHRLQRLHHTVTSQRANTGLRPCSDLRKEARVPQY